jgi:hypothetical protein
MSQHLFNISAASHCEYKSEVLFVHSPQKLSYNNGIQTEQLNK